MGAGQPGEPQWSLVARRPRAISWDVTSPDLTVHLGQHVNGTTLALGAPLVDSRVGA